MLKTPRTLPERFNAPESALHQNQEKCPPCRAPMPPSDPAPQGSRKGRRYPAGGGPQSRPQSLPLRGRWHGEAVTDEGCPSAGIGGRGGSGTRPYATPQIQELRAGGRPRPCKGLRENCAPYRAPSPIGPHTQTGQGTVPHVVQRPGPAPHHIHPSKLPAGGGLTPSACLSPITWACRCTAGHSTTDGSA